MGWWRQNVAFLAILLWAWGKENTFIGQLILIEMTWEWHLLSKILFSLPEFVELSVLWKECKENALPKILDKLLRKRDSE